MEERQGWPLLEYERVVSTPLSGVSSTDMQNEDKYEQFSICVRERRLLS